jgi:hypothetical protein
MIEFDLNDLRAAFGACARVADGRRTAVLGNVLVDPGALECSLLASDGENYISVDCKATCGASDWLSYELISVLPQVKEFAFITNYPYDPTTWMSWRQARVAVKR